MTLKPILPRIKPNTNTNMENNNVNSQGLWPTAFFELEGGEEGRSEAEDGGREEGVGMSREEGEGMRGGRVEREGGEREGERQFN